MNESVKVWKEISSYIEASMSTVSYEMWFGKLVPLTIENNKLILVAPLVSVKRTVDGFKDTVIKEAIEKSGTYISDIVVVLEEEAEVYKPEKEPAPIEKPVEEDNFRNVLDPSFTFDNFVVGDCNNIASSAAKAVAENPGVLYNPLFIYGGVGLGKTHIMQAIGNYILSADKNKKILYVTTEQFVNEFVDSIMKNKDNKLNKSFREKYRSADVLMIDDIQFLANKTSTQEALFHTFNDLYQNKKQIVLSSDRHPKELTFLEERLKSRFQSGLTVDITNPSVETRVAILRKKAEIKKFRVSNDVIFFIADNITSNVRELEGALLKVMFYCDLMGKECNVDVAKEALKDYIDVTTHVISIDNIVDATCTYFNIKRADIIGKKKVKNIVNARQIAIYLINDLLGIPLNGIGDYFGGRDHTTIMYARDKIGSLFKTDPLVQAQINDLRAMIQKK